MGPFRHLTCSRSGALDPLADLVTVHPGGEVLEVHIERVIAWAAAEGYPTSD